MQFQIREGKRGASDKVSAWWPEGSRFETRSHQRSAMYVGPVRAKSDFVDQTPSRWCVEAWREVPAYMSSSSSDCGSKLRDPP
ncbi:hypothetical protein AVEN_267457-1 [Araneus ventricosus]|uniref:Uncharacterized protein n=1 Tax=Araneus ventricosus TaxID=182803 RepID=A0A4Y2F3L7_ARAVE|nr:hypothetical protein AVEN_267457-1 [Araneus ventricosus]